MSENTYQIETRRRSRSKTPFLRSSCDNENCEHTGEVGHVHHKTKSSVAPNERTIIEELVFASSSSKNTRSKAFAKVTSDYSSDDMTPENKRKQDSTRITVTSIFNKRSDCATSTPRNRSQLETTQNTLNSVQEKMTHANGNISSGNVSDYLAYIEYKEAGEYWNKTPKTDYTYSELSPHRRQLAPGIVAMPNMSRRSLGNHDERVNFMVQKNPDQEEFIRRRYQSKNQRKAIYDSADELDTTFAGHQKQSWWIFRFIQLLVSSITTVWTRITDVSDTESDGYHSYYAKRQKSQQAGGFAFAVLDGLSRLLRHLYIFIGSVLSLDTWILQTSNAENKSKKRFLILLLVLLPLLLLTGLFHYLHPNETFPPKSLTEYTFTLPDLPTINLSDYLNQAQYESLRSQATEKAVRVRDWADDYVLYLKTIGLNVVSKGRQFIGVDDQIVYERWSLLQENQRLVYFQRAEAFVPLPLTFLTSLQGRLFIAGSTIKGWFKLPAVKSLNQEADAVKLNIDNIERNIQKALTAEEFENILIHIKSYVQQLSEQKMQELVEERQQLSHHQVELINRLIKENMQQFASKTQLSEQTISDLSLKLKLELQRLGEWQAEAKLSRANLDEIVRLIKAELTLHELHYTPQLEQIDFAALLKRILGAAELTEFVDALLNLRAQHLASKEGSGFLHTEEQIDQLNREIAFIKLSLSKKQAENADLHQSISSLQISQKDLLERLQQLDLAQDRRFSVLLSEIEGKLAALNDSQFALLNNQIKLSLIEILGFKHATADGAQSHLNDMDLQNWIRSMFVAKDFLEQQLLELNKRTNNNIRDEIERSSILLMNDISSRLKREMLLVVEAKHNESTRALKSQIHDDEVRQIVKTVLAIYDADKTGLVDFALESAGGQILSTRCTESYQTKSAQISVFGVPLWYPTNTPRVAISPNVQPGECWAFQGFPGFLVLKLNSLIYVTGFTLEHIPKSLSPTARIDSAPRNFTVWGLEHEKDQEPVLFGEFEYQDNGASLQYFAIQNLDIKRPYEIVELRIETNHGQPMYTCLYRFRVHGKPPST